MIAAQTVEGKRARKLVLLLKRVLQDYVVAEQERPAAALDADLLSELARANALQQHLDGLRAQQQHQAMESVMRIHGAWIKVEEYELSLSDEQIKAVFDVITRLEELLNVTPLEEYHTLLSLLDHRLRTDVRTQVVPHTFQQTPAESSRPRLIVSPYKAVVDAWPVHMLQHGTLPTGEIQSEHLRSRLLCYARSVDADSNSQTLTLTAST